MEIILKLWSSGLWRHIVMQEETNILEHLATSIFTCHITIWCHNPYDHNSNPQCHENQKSQIGNNFCNHYTMHINVHNNIQYYKMVPEETITQVQGLGSQASSELQIHLDLGLSISLCLWGLHFGVSFHNWIGPIFFNVLDYVHNYCQTCL